MIQEIHKLSDIKEETFLIYKHSITCSVSAHANQIIKEFSEKHPEVAIYKIVVQTDEELKWEIADRYGVKHETPQVIIVREGRVIASQNHYNIERLEQFYTNV